MGGREGAAPGGGGAGLLRWMCAQAEVWGMRHALPGHAQTSNDPPLNALCVPHPTCCCCLLFAWPAGSWGTTMPTCQRLWRSASRCGAVLPQCGTAACACRAASTAPPLAPLLALVRCAHRSICTLHTCSVHLRRALPASACICLPLMTIPASACIRLPLMTLPASACPCPASALQVLAKGDKLVEAEVAQQMAGLLKQMQAALPAEVFQGFVAALKPKQQQRLQEVLAGGV